MIQAEYTGTIIAELTWLRLRETVRGWQAVNRGTEAQRKNVASIQWDESDDEHGNDPNMSILQISHTLWALGWKGSFCQATFHHDRKILWNIHLNDKRMKREKKKKQKRLCYFADIFPSKYFIISWDFIVFSLVFGFQLWENLALVFHLWIIKSLLLVKEFGIMEN